MSSTLHVTIFIQDLGLKKYQMVILKSSDENFLNDNYVSTDSC